MLTPSDVLVVPFTDSAKCMNPPSLRDNVAELVEVAFAKDPVTATGRLMLSVGNITATL
jgi:hypothetical protein